MTAPESPVFLDPADQAALDRATRDYEFQQRYQAALAMPVAEPVEPDDEPDDMRPTLAGWCGVALIIAVLFISFAALVWIAAAVIVAITHVPMWCGVVTVLGVVALVVWAWCER